MIFSFRGDAHKLYLKLKQSKHMKSDKVLSEVAEIKEFYESIDRYTLKLIYYRMIKERNGLGIIPIFVTSIPWLLFLFSKKIQDVLFANGNLLWISFTLSYLIILTISAILHFKEKAWAAIHIQIIEDILSEKN
ncbi:hypothetical protein ACLIA0_14040 [Bacillaceae bacterium W0354]